MKCLPKDCIIARDLGANCRMLFRYNHDRLNSLHSFNDQPSMVDLNGTIFYHKNGLRHRDNDKPAVIQTDGSIYFYKKHTLYKKELI